eukprot:3616860-Pyramimonas_sp.AAC.1
MAATTPVSPVLPLTTKIRSEWVRGLRVLREASDQTILEILKQEPDRILRGLGGWTRLEAEAYTAAFGTRLRTWGRFGLGGNGWGLLPENGCQG